MKRKYSRNHPLWPVYDLQKQIIKKGGEINRYSDLLAHFEGKSLAPNIDARTLFSNLIIFNQSISNNSLFKKEKLIYKEKTRGFDCQLPWGKEHFKFSNEGKWGWECKRISIEDSIPEGYLYKPNTEFKEIDIRFQNMDFKDNEFVWRNPNIDYVFTLNAKYENILRLLKNGYNPEKKEMNNNKNLLPSIIIAIAIIIAAFLYVYANRYEIDYPLKIDKWKGTMIKLEYKE